ncbi:MAG: HD domain-containing protein [Rhodobacter sp.]|nr:HD domain-containing protein [Rhodobacter sp.]
MTVPNLDALTPHNIVDFLAGIFERRGAEAYLGEDVTMSQHMLQGAELAERAGAGDEMIAAALLHDIGHFTSEFPEDALHDNVDARHEDAGARVLERFFPAVVVDCVRHHVAAKRYLCATDPGYLGKLSAASIHTLNLQGGPMDEAEVAEFARNPNLDAILQVRLWDDAGKDPKHQAPPFSNYAPVLERLVHRTNA